MDKKTYYYLNHLLVNTPEQDKILHYAKSRNLSSLVFSTYKGGYKRSEVEEIMKRLDCENLILNNIHRLGRNGEEVKKFLYLAKREKVNIYIMDMDLCINHSKMTPDAQLTTNMFEYIADKHGIAHDLDNDIQIVNEQIDKFLIENGGKHLIEERDSLLGKLTNINTIYKDKK